MAAAQQHELAIARPRQDQTVLVLREKRFHFPAADSHPGGTAGTESTRAEDHVQAVGIPERMSVGGRAVGHAARQVAGEAR